MNAKQLFDLTGRTAIVTGGGRGLGAQIAQGLAEAGANLVLCSRNVETCEETVTRIQQDTGVSCAAMACDVRNPEDVRRVVEQTAATFGRIDILVNNSGASWGAPAVDMPLEAWNKVMDINVTGTFLMSQAVGRVMIEQNGGKIINIASIAGLSGTDPKWLDAVGYSASKGAVIAFTRDLAVKWGKHHININAIAPGFFPTKMTREILHQGGEQILSLTPLGRLGSDSDLKGSAVFLASDASNYMTGAVLTVDGGMSAM
ncbi:SDR family oxidoreductase [Paenibacillus apiarius]|uniref:SDR family oxidoreductase n=1 Tax=Paenibacillus apiarius TaxID=46240 RepID=A0ABT4DX38_9BACL|nr:SDR family oxidoreductase [Paenibacillus apiarius]MCY9516821.1 SDR family oxidoreductase [Paenibacillus apiarius]MCY9521914.1 SDR family oxidoreductase [Paenibacillus apiarius]MCY9550460.1 SDR family oxidoreductase [Paenibacillus apiarius]MCY9559891.1 SDR family oxidoreductase [Paenibacillus apiarius]MCY9683425.1 SDR family oxidoreductase [Paenibacillus apiarius]